MTTPYYYYYAFGVNANDLPASPTPLTPPVGGNVNYYTGWTSPYELNLLTNPAALPIPRDQFNRLWYDVTLNIQWWQQFGTPNFITSTDNQGSAFPYALYARTYYGGSVYENLVPSNTATPGTDNTWLLVSGNATGVRPGTIIDWAGPIPPAGYLFANGANISRATYPTLMANITQIQSVTTTVSATITGLSNVGGINCTTTMYPGMHVESPNLPSGTTILTINSPTSITVSNTASAGATTITFFSWGNGDGSTTFTLPNFNGITSMGAGGTPGTTTQAPSYGLAATITGTTGGEAQHTQLPTELANHQHAFTLGSSTSAGAGEFILRSDMHNHDIVNATAAFGSATPFNVIQPTAIVTKCIKT